MAHQGTLGRNVIGLASLLSATAFGCASSSAAGPDDTGVADAGTADTGAPDAAMPAGTLHVVYVSPFPNTVDGPAEVVLEPIAGGLTRLAVRYFDEGDPMVADDEGVIHLAVDLDTAALAAGHTFVLDGAATLDTSASGSASWTPPWDTGMTVAFVPASAADAAVRRVAFYHGCHCDQVSHYEQTVSGTLELDSYDGAVAAGSLRLAIDGGIAAYSIAPNARATIDLAFAGAAVMH